MKKQLHRLFAIGLLVFMAGCSGDDVSEPADSNVPPDEEQPTNNITELWGMTIGGGVNSLGTIFKTDQNGNNYATVHSFDGNDGKYPIGGLVHATNGKLYGITSKGGINNKGVIFEFNPTNQTYSKKIDLSISSSGGEPLGQGSLIETSNNKLYGISGKYIFRYDATSNDFQIVYTMTASEGNNAKGSFLEASNGKLYALTSDGGNNFDGTLIEFDSSTNTLIKKVDFGGVNGDSPNGDLVQATNGKLYGLTSYGGGTVGGNFYQGVLFEFDPNTDSFAVKYRFINSAEIPQRGLIQASNSKLYGVTSNGGSAQYGVIFEYDLNSPIIIIKHHFSPADGERKGKLVQSSNGKLYGFNYDGDSQPGSLYEYDLVNNSYAVKKQFEAGTPSPQFPSSNNGHYCGNLIGL